MKKYSLVKLFRIHIHFKGTLMSLVLGSACFYKWSRISICIVHVHVHKATQKTLRQFHAIPLTESWWR